MSRTINVEDALRMMQKMKASGGGGTIVEETDPTVPSWAKQPNKPTYTAAEVGALPRTTTIPSKTSQLTNDSGFLTQHQDLSSYAKKTEVPTKTSQLTNDSGFLKAIPSEYVTESELTAKKYLSSVPSEYVTDSELTAKGYAKQTDLNGLSEEIANHINNDLDWFSKGTSIPANADLDTYQTLGKFYCASDSRAGTLVNCPTNNNFCMWVFERTDYVTQLIITLPAKMYVRSRSSSAWRDWVVYATSKDIDDLLERIDDISEEINGGNTEIFYTETGEEHQWDEAEWCICFDMTTPLVAGNNYNVTIDGVSHVVTASSDEFADYPCVALKGNTDWRIYYGDALLDFLDTNTVYFPDEEHSKEDEDGMGELIPHSLKIAGKGKTLKEKVDDITKNIVELDVTYDDGTTGTLKLFGEVKA